MGDPSSSRRRESIGEQCAVRVSVGGRASSGREWGGDLMKKAVMAAAFIVVLALAGKASAFTSVELRCGDGSRAMGFITKGWPGTGQEEYAVATTLHAVNNCNHIKVYIRPCDGSHMSARPDLV